MTVGLPDIAICNIHIKHNDASLQCIALSLSSHSITQIPVKILVWRTTVYVVSVPMLLVRNSSILTQIVIVVLLKLNHNGSELEMFIIVYFRSDF